MRARVPASAFSARRRGRGPLGDNSQTAAEARHGCADRCLSRADRCRGASRYREHSACRARQPCRQPTSPASGRRSRVGSRAPTLLGVERLAATSRARLGEALVYAVRSPGSGPSAEQVGRPLRCCRVSHLSQRRMIAMSLGGTSMMPQDAVARPALQHPGQFGTDQLGRFTHQPSAEFVAPLVVPVHRHTDAYRSNRLPQTIEDRAA